MTTFVVLKILSSLILPPASLAVAAILCLLLLVMRRKRLATLVLLRMPMPSTEIFATRAALVTSRQPSCLASFSAACRLFVNSPQKPMDEELTAPNGR